MTMTTARITSGGISRLKIGTPAVCSRAMGWASCWLMPRRAVVPSPDEAAAAGADGAEGVEGPLLAVALGVLAAGPPATEGDDSVSSSTGGCAASALAVSAAVAAPDALSAA